MKRSFTLLILLFIGSQAFSQGAKKYVLLEHFTNSECSICASRNPAFYNTIQGYEEDIHHITYHPSVPYPSCVFHQANPADNNARANYYNVLGTPRMYMLGSSASSGVTLLPEDDLIAQLGQTSPIEILVDLSEQGADRTADVTVNTLGDQPIGDFRLFVAAVEKTINQTTGNGEDEHFDVLRDFLTSADGDLFSPASTGESVSLSFDFTIPAEWNADQIYVLAFVQEINTKEVLNSRASTDVTVTSSKRIEATEYISIYPNPANTEAWVTIDTDGQDIRTGKVQIFTLEGKLISTQQVELLDNQLRLDLGSFEAGYYLFKLTSDEKSWSTPLIKY